MLTLYSRAPSGGLGFVAGEVSAPDDPRVLWVDLFNPTEDEERHVEGALKLDVPAPRERVGEEESARFYEEDGALFLTATLLGRREDGPFISDAVTFILKDGKLVTVRTIRPRSFDLGQGRASARVDAAKTGADALTALLAGTVERLADLIAETRRAARDLSVDIFAEKGDAPPLRATLTRLGRLGTTTALIQDSLASLQRLALYAEQVCPNHNLPTAAFKALQLDTQELERNASALETHLNLLQEGALGLVGATQAETLKALALATIAFVPPTLVASIFGMNFAHMTWFNTPWGPWVGFALMLAAPAALFALARWRGWF
ncbi:MAG: CorA family divalent cation transporter [Hyphomonadaceae bacterium]